MFEIVMALAVLGWAARAIVRTVMEADIRKMELRRSAGIQQSTASTAEIEQLKAEIMRLRDTTTEHALSLQHTVERLDRRVDHLERMNIEANVNVNRVGR